jgi:hypothetical protein
MVRLFRQDQARDYKVVLDKVRSELSALIAAGNGSGRGAPGA